ncbi:MAG: thiamine phosphate synthase [Candidatus Acidiferrum sp.]
MRLVLPRLYVILDPALLTTRAADCGEKLIDAGVRLVQYRDKNASPAKMLKVSRELKELFEPRGVTFFVNDRADVAALSGAAGVHVGQDDLEAERARVTVGMQRFVGISTHNLEQFKCAAASSADYIAIGPIFATATKSNPGPVVGIELLREVRSLTRKLIVAIGGITLERAAEVIAAGANSVAVIGDILRAPNPARRAKQFIDSLGEASPDS